MTELLSPALAGTVAGLGVAMPMGAMSVLLLQEAVRDRRTAVAAASGVAAVDLGYAALATALGPWVASHVAPVEAWIRLAAAAVLLAIAAHGLTGAARIRQPAPTAAGGAAGAGVGAGGAGGTGGVGGHARTGKTGGTSETGRTGGAGQPGGASGVGGAGGRDCTDGAGGTGPNRTTDCTGGAGGTGGTGPNRTIGPGGVHATSRAGRAGRTRGTGEAAPGAWRGRGAVFARYVALTAVNPTTALYFAALTTAQGAALSSGAAATAFLTGVAAASLLWQQTLVVLGSLAGRRISPTARIWTFRLGYGLVAAYALKIALPLPW
ncbi:MULTISPECIES: LysE family transporter [Streptomyces]|uniref:LysE family transporter n=1 Tax=Streptomyces TaxID=1883 RepID=UPI001676A8BF|nr:MULTISPECIES: LysE family transporter [Streptomyces]MBD3576686.1 LysE family transporter [Streptomyces sp. KD18]